MDEPRKFPPNVMLTQMRQRVSRKGAAFLEGRLGLVESAASAIEQERRRRQRRFGTFVVQEPLREDTARPAATEREHGRDRPVSGPPCEFGRCPNHGGLSTGPRTKAGRARIAKAQKQRWKAYRDRKKSLGHESL